jgi:hypothetical protein
MRKVVFALVLAVSIFGSFSISNTTFSGQANAQLQKMVWCCDGCQVMQTTPTVCREKGGVVYRTQYEALKYCQLQKCMCCSKCKIAELKCGECKLRGGVCYRTKDEALKYCPR